MMDHMGLWISGGCGRLGHTHTHTRTFCYEYVFFFFCPYTRSEELNVLVVCCWLRIAIYLKETRGPVYCKGGLYMTCNVTPPFQLKHMLLWMFITKCNALISTLVAMLAVGSLVLKE